MKRIQIVRKWNEFDHFIQESLTPEQIDSFVLNEQSDLVNETVSGKDANTFPKNAWIDQNRAKWVRVGKYTWDFKSKRGVVPYGEITLRKTIGNTHFKLFCRVEQAFINTIDVIDDAITYELGKRHLSKVCGRAVLILNEYSIVRKHVRYDETEKAKDDEIRREYAKQNSRYESYDRMFPNESALAYSRSATLQSRVRKFTAARRSRTIPWQARSGSNDIDRFSKD